MVLWFLEDSWKVQFTSFLAVERPGVPSPALQNNIGGGDDDAGGDSGGGDGNDDGCDDGGGGGNDGDDVPP